MRFFKVDVRYNQPNREAQIMRCEILGRLVDYIEDPEPFRYYLNIWNRDRVWDLELTDAEIEAVCDDTFMDDVWAYVDSYAKALRIDLRRV